MNPFCCHRYAKVNSRREFLSKWAFGFGTLPVIHLLSRESLLETVFAEAARDSAVNPLAPKAPHFPAQGKNVVFIYLQGGASHVDTLDPKPRPGAGLTVRAYLTASHRAI